MKIQLIGCITGNQNAENDFKSINDILCKNYPDAEIFNPMTQGFMQEEGESFIEFDTRCFIECIKNLSKMTGKEDFAVLVNDIVHQSLSYAEFIFCIKHNIVTTDKNQLLDGDFEIKRKILLCSKS